jgi:hypothetical protein
MDERCPLPIQEDDVEPAAPLAYPETEVTGDRAVFIYPDPLDAILPDHEPLGIIVIPVEVERGIRAPQYERGQRRGRQAK